VLFTIHRSFIVHHSPYFEKLFKELDESLFVSEKIPSTVYKETTADAFGLFMRYIYRGNIKDNKNNNPPVMHAVQLWLLAGKISTPILQNIAMDCIFENKCAVGVPGMLYIYEKTDRGSPLRKIVVEQGLVRNYNAHALIALFHNNMDQLPKELLTDMIIAQEKLLPAGVNLPRCKVTDFYVRSVDRSV
jgi:hypothetical protein